MMIATHSRPLEGELMTLLSDSGWLLQREKPLRYGPSGLTIGAVPRR